jgi:hypothetical protein
MALCREWPPRRHGDDIIALPSGLPNTVYANDGLYSRRSFQLSWPMRAV